LGFLELGTVVAVTGRRGAVRLPERRPRRGTVERVAQVAERVECDRSVAAFGQVVDPELRRHFVVRESGPSALHEHEQLAGFVGVHGFPPTRATARRTISAPWGSRGGAFDWPRDRSRNRSTCSASRSTRAMSSYGVFRSFSPRLWGERCTPRQASIRSSSG